MSKALSVCLAVFLPLVPTQAGSSGLAESFPIGSGSKFAMTSQGVRTEVQVYIVAHGPETLSFETYFTSPMMFSDIHLWQRFELALRQGTPPRLVRGWIQDDKTDRPEELSSDRLRGSGDLDVTGFFFTHDSDGLAKIKVGDEEVVTPAGKTRAAHYRRKTGKQQVDFWISSEAKPLGLVKLVSTGSNKLENYELQLVSLLTGASEKIDIKRSVPLSERMKKMLSASR